jgi:hypothetical protein
MFEFVPSAGVPANAPMEQAPFDWGQFFNNQKQMMVDKAGPLFSGTPQGDASLATLLGTAGAAIAPKDSWQANLSQVGANLGKTMASQQQTKGAQGNLPATTENIAAKAQTAGTPPVGGINTAQDTNSVIQKTMKVPASRMDMQPGAIPSTAPVPAPAPAPGQVQQAVAPQPVAPQPGVQPGQATSMPVPQAGGPANFQQAPGQVPSLEAQVPSAIGPSAGTPSDVDSRLLALGLGDPKTFQDNYKMISEARAREAQSSNQMAEAAAKMRPFEMQYGAEKAMPYQFSMATQLENTVRHGQVMDDLASNERGRIEARSKEYDQMPLNPVMQKKFGVQTWGQMMRMNPGQVAAFGDQLRYDSAMAQVGEMAKTRLQGHDWNLWAVTQKDLAGYAGKFTPEEWNQMKTSDPEGAARIEQASMLKGTTHIMTPAEAHQYGMSNQAMDALSTKLGLPTGYANSIRQQSLQPPPISKDAYVYQMKLLANQQRQAELQGTSEILKKYGMAPATPEQTMTDQFHGGMGVAAWPSQDLNEQLQQLIKSNPQAAAEYEALRKHIQSMTLRK